MVELVIAATISTFLALGVISLTIFSGRFNKSTFTQQRSLKEAKETIETINREIRLAVAPLRVTDSGGNPGSVGHRVEFARPGEIDGLRSFELISQDDNFMTPWDNSLVFDPDTSTAGDELEICDMLTPLNLNGAFSYLGATIPLVVQMRTGDPVGTGDLEQSNARTGVGIQGFEINITVAPRN